MNKIEKFNQYLDNNKKIYINSNTGRGKTLLASLLALFFLEYHKGFKVISNYHLNIFDKKTNKSLCEFTKYGFISESRLDKGKFLIIIDDFKAVERYLQNFGNILAVLSRKAFIYTFITLHYYTHLSKENREMFNIEILINALTHLIYNPLTHNDELSYKSKLKCEFYETSSLELTRKETFYNLLFFVLGNYSLNNVYVKGKLYDTYEIVHRPDITEILQEVLKYSNNEVDLRKNIRLITKNEAKQNKYFRELSLQL